MKKTRANDGPFKFGDCNFFRASIKLREQAFYGISISNFPRSERYLEQIFGPVRRLVRVYLLEARKDYLSTQDFLGPSWSCYGNRKLQENGEIDLDNGRLEEGKTGISQFVNTCAFPNLAFHSVPSTVVLSILNGWRSHFHTWCVKHVYRFPAA